VKVREMSQLEGHLPLYFIEMSLQDACALCKIFCEEHLYVRCDCDRNE